MTLAPAARAASTPGLSCDYIPSHIPFMLESFPDPIFFISAYTKPYVNGCIIKPHYFVFELSVVSATKMYSFTQLCLRLLYTKLPLLITMLINYTVK